MASPIRPTNFRIASALLGLWALVGVHAPFAWAREGIAPVGETREQLPGTVRPLHYDLNLHPDADRLVFSAEVSIEIQVNTVVSAVVLNAKNLEFDTARLESGNKAAITLDPVLEQATLRFADAVSAGRHTLAIRYHGEIARATLGFFAMDYDSPSGKRRTLATNFEPAAERTFMPSWDEPASKATFRLTVDTPADRMAISNMPVETETLLPDGQKRVRFAQTPKMSTYLLFLAIGEFQRLSQTVDGVQVGVVVAKGDADKARYALAQAALLLHYYNDYFGTRYPLPKLDLVAAPGQIDGGSMENWGAILYSQNHVLFDPGKSSESERQEVFEVVAHEMAHQWFGDLVTMAWWNDLWLNEGFARWMQTKAADDLHPQWETGLQAWSIVEKGMRADAKTSTHPVEQSVSTAAEAELAFDVITYDKGAAVIGMLEKYLGREPFRDGMRRYMRDHAYGNAVSADLWAALQRTAGKTVRAIADDFTLRPGLPLVTVLSEQQDAGSVRADLLQSRFLEAHRGNDMEAPVAAWRLPLTMRAVSGSSAARMLDGASGTIELAGARPAVINAGHNSYTRVRYAPEVFDELAARFASLAPSDQIAMLQDAWALGQSEYAPITNVLLLVDALPLDADPIVWSSAIPILVTIDTRYADLPGRKAYRAWARRRLAALAARVGWTQPAAEPAKVSLLRSPLLLALGRFGDTNVIGEARRLYGRAVDEPTDGRMQSGRIARGIVAANADSADFAQLVERLNATLDPLDRQRLLEDLTTVADPALAERVLDLAVGPQAPAGTMPNLLADVAYKHPDLTWRFAIAHVDAPGFPLDRSSRMTLLPQILSGSADLSYAEELRAYARAHLPAAASRDVEAAVAQIRLNSRVRDVGLPQIDNWLLAER